MMSELTQAETNAALASPPGSVTASGRTILIDKFTSATVFGIYEWGSDAARKQYNPFREVVDALDGLEVDPSDRTRLLQQAGMVKSAGEIPADQITKCLRSADGVAFQLWLLSRKYHPDLSFEACRQLVTEENRLDLYVQLDSASGANIVNKALVSAGFTVPASQDASAGLSPSAEVQSEPSSTAT